LDSVLDENTIIYGKRPVVRKTLSILKPEDLLKMTGVPGGIGRGRPFTGFAKDVDPLAKLTAAERADFDKLDRKWPNFTKEELTRWDRYTGKTARLAREAKDATPQERARRKLSPDQAARLKALLAKVKTAPSAAAPMPRAKDASNTEKPGYAAALKQLIKLQDNDYQRLCNTEDAARDRYKQASREDRDRFKLEEKWNAAASAVKALEKKMDDIARPYPGIMDEVV
jgi:hypothetical protein